MTTPSDSNAPLLDPVPTESTLAAPRLGLAKIAWANWRNGQSIPSSEHSTACRSLPLARARRMRRSGKAFLFWIFVCYVLSQLALFGIKDRWRTIGPANEARKWPAFHRLNARHPERPLVLMLGSSRTCWAFDAGSLDGTQAPDGRTLRVYNFGIPTTGPVHELLYLRQMIAEGVRPELLLIEYLPPLLGEPVRGALTEESMTGFSWVSCGDFLRMLPYLARPGRRSREWLEAHLMPTYAFRQSIQIELLNWAKGISRQDYPAVDAWGWHPMTPTPFPADERERLVEMAHKGYTPALSQFRLGSKPRRALYELLELCRRERIPTALVLMPESSEFRSWYSEEAHDATRGLLNELSRTYDSPIIDAEQWLADEDFEDGHHVLAHGAAVFTQRLSAEIARLLNSPDRVASKP